MFRPITGLYNDGEKENFIFKRKVALRRIKRHYEPDEANWKENSWSEVHFTSTFLTFGILNHKTIHIDQGWPDINVQYLIGGVMTIRFLA